MSPAADDPLAAGRRALAEGDWAGARRAYRDALGRRESTEALLGLADAEWWLGEIRESVSLKERAYAVLQERGDHADAAMVAWQLAMDYGDGLGHAAAGQGWLSRTRRMVDDLGLEPLRGWVLLLDAYFAADPKVREQVASRVLELAREASDNALELCALSQVGAALVEQGRVVEGVQMLDEAMVGTLSGEAGRPEPVVFTSCTTLKACVSCADFDRAVQWLRATDRFAERFGGPYLGATCRIRYGTLLVAIGDWAQAEEELTAAVDRSAGRLPSLHSEALAALAWLRLAQGRVEEAARLVEGLEGHPGTAMVIGSVHLLRGRAQSARSVLQRELAGVRVDRLQIVPLRELLGQALVACGETEAAREHGEALVELGAAHDCAIATGYGERLLGRLEAGSSTAGARLDAALATFIELGMPWEVARTRLLLARHLRDRAPEAAADEARVALAALDGLGARRDADAAAALLRELGESPGRGVRANATLTRREQEVLALLGDGLSNPEIAERLYLSRKTVEHHVARVLSKLGLRSRAEAAAEAVRARSGRR